MKKLMFFWDELTATFWFIPVLILFTSLCLAFGLIYIDSIAKFQPGGIGHYLLIGSPDSARRVLSIISGAMIGVAGTVFSITLVALSLASSQFGPRLLKNFMYDRINQVVLGSYISTFLYCLIVLNSIKGNDQFTFIPAFSVLFALITAIGNIILLIVFIHHIAVSIQADNVISNINESLSDNVRNLYPEKVGHGLPEKGMEDEELLKSLRTYRYNVNVTKSGYLQYLDGESFLNFAVKNNALVELFYRPGDYLVEGMELATIYADIKMEQDELNRCRSYFLTGKVRTPQQDTEHSIHQMVEIACRALSPGVNDPYTAIACIDNLTSAMCYLSGVNFPSKYRYDDERTLRVIVKPLTYEGIFDAAFNQIRQFGHSIPSVAVRLMEAFIVIDGFTDNRQQKDVLKKHVRMVLNMAEKTFEEPNDLNDLKERSKLIAD
jgi:uncharacterized membrane protein